jgi:hypothetical protein
LLSLHCSNYVIIFKCNLNRQATFGMVEFLDGMDFSFGFDTLNLKPRGVAIKVDDPIPKPVTGGGGQIVNFSLQRVTSMEDFQSSLDIGVKVLGSYGLFSGSAKFNYSESQKTKSFSDYVIVKVSVENPLLMIHGIKPT